MSGEGWPVVVARPLTGSEAIQMQLALDARDGALMLTDADEALGVTRELLAALDAGRVRIEVEDEPEVSDEEAAFHDRHVINDDAWEAAKEADRG